MKEIHDLTNETERAILVAVNPNNQPHFEESIKELKNLAEACDIEVVGQVVQNLPKFHTGHYVGSGKIEEIRQLIDAEEADLLIVEDELSPSQMRNLDKHLNIQILDRTRLILEIFNRRAQTKEAKNQVEVANLKYILPRLRDSNQDFDRQRGGGTKNRGAGETKLELNRRKLEFKISELEKELKAIAETRKVHRKGRESSGIPRVALVGYTNAGKSTTMNQLIQQFRHDQNKQVFEKDMLFATLDTSVRNIEFGNGKQILLSDTVGFINKLPHHLVRAFHSTLEEVMEADLLLHVMDVSNPHLELHKKVTNETLEKMGAGQIPQIEVYNKIDLLPVDLIVPEAAVKLSAKKNIGFEALQKAIENHLFTTQVQVKLLIPHKDSALISTLKQIGHIMAMDYVDTGVALQVELAEEQVKRYEQYLV